MYYKVHLNFLSSGLAQVNITQTKVYNFKLKKKKKLHQPAEINTVDTPGMLVAF